MVRETEVPESGNITHLIKYDHDFYRRWIKRAAAFVNHGDTDCVILCFGERHPTQDSCMFPEDPEYEKFLAATRPAKLWTR